MKNKHGIEIPRKCLTCHYKRESSVEGKVKCALHYIYANKSDICNDYIMSKKFDDVGKTFGKVRALNLDKVYDEALKNDPSCNKEELSKRYNEVSFIL